MKRWAVCAFFWVALFNASATDILNYFVSKGVIYAQPNEGTVQAKPSPFAFHARVQVSNQTSLTQGQIYRGFFQDPISPAGTGTRFWSTVRLFSTSSGLDSFYPDATYGVVLQTAHDGVRSNALTVTVSDFPPAPHVLNYNAAQAIDPAADFLVRWDLWSGNPLNAVSLLVFDGKSSGRIAFQTSVSGEDDSLHIPTGTLAPGRAYLARLRFDAIISSNLTSYPGVRGFASAFAATDFQLRTIGADENTAPRIVYVSPANGAVNVPVSTAVSWAFNRPMQTNAVSFTFPSGLSTRRTYSGGNFVLTIAPTNAFFTSNALQRWGLQNWNDSVFLMDLDGNPLFADAVGSFTTSSSTNPPPAPTAPRLDIPVPDGTNVQLTVCGQTNRTFMFHSTTNFTNWSMAALASTTTNTSASVTESNANANGARFFRAIALP